MALNCSIHADFKTVSKGLTPIGKNKTAILTAFQTAFDCWSVIAYNESMLGDFLLKKAVERSLGGMAPEEQEKFVKMVEDHPDLFKKLAREYKEKIAQGKSQMDAATEVVAGHAIELRAIQE